MHHQVKRMLVVISFLANSPQPGFKLAGSERRGI
jgi:hypothetical protein